MHDSTEEHPLPPAFVERMHRLLGSEAGAFFETFGRAPLAGLRTNTLKLGPDRLRELVDWPLVPVAWCSAGFSIDEEARPGAHPYHAAGLYYMQEPSAMAVAEALRPQPGDLVLDLAAAPGGKATHLAALMGDRGLLVANDIEARRVRALLSNLERWGPHNAIVTNEAPERLAEHWGAIFNRVLLDAPCSGEGMFRKAAHARAEWSSEMVQGCALRQARALHAAAALVRPGGLLAYSTCTFAPEENEQVLARFLDAQRDFELIPISITGAEPGRPEWAPAEVARPELARAARLWPHRVAGEGHFIALLRRVDGNDPSPRAPALPAAPRAAREAWRGFVAEALTTDPFSDAPLSRVGGQLYALPEQLPQLDRVRVARAGLWLGTMRKGRFEPSHSLALALRAADAQQLLDLAPGDERLQRYLQGHPLPEPGPPGWVLIAVSGFPLGWGRRSQGIIKNAYPKGLRRPA